MGSRQKPSNFQNNIDLAFQYKLARDLGMTVSEMLIKMPLKEYNQWINFYNWEQREKNKAYAMAEAESKKKR